MYYHIILLVCLGESLLNIYEELLQEIFANIVKQVNNFASILVLVPLLHFQSLSFCCCVYVGLHRVVVLMPSTLHNSLSRNPHGK